MMIEFVLCFYVIFIYYTQLDDEDDIPACNREEIV